jgi:hypothetical protein
VEPKLLFLFVFNNGPFFILRYWLTQYECTYLPVYFSRSIMAGAMVLLNFYYYLIVSCLVFSYVCICVYVFASVFFIYVLAYFIIVLYAAGSARKQIEN